MFRARFLVFMMSISLISVACASGPSSSSSSSPQTKQGRAALEAIILTAQVMEQEEGVVAVELELKNGTSRLLGANMCRATLERLPEAGEEWEPVELELRRECVDEDESIGPGGIREAVYILTEPQEELFAADLRFSMNVEYPIGVDFNKIASAPFELAGAAQSEPQEQEEAEEPAADDEAHDPGEQED